MDGGVGNRPWSTRVGVFTMIIFALNTGAWPIWTGVTLGFCNVEKKRGMVDVRGRWSCSQYDVAIKKRWGCNENGWVEQCKLSQ